MAENSRPKREVRTSMKGVFVWPKLTKADTKFKAAGEFSVKLEVTKEVAAALMAEIDTLAAESLAAAKEAAKTPKDKKAWETKYLPYEIMTDENEVETGMVQFKFGRVASGVTKKDNKPWVLKSIPMFDAKGKPMKAEPWNGTVGKVSFAFNKYAQTPQTGASVQLQLEAVQILELKSGSGRSADEYGFSGDEDGYEYTPDESGGESNEGEKSGNGGGESAAPDEADF